MIRHSRTWPIAVSLLLCSAPAGHAQAAAGVDTIYHLHGTVINAFTGKPLARALVESGDQRLATMTGNEGQFAIDISVPTRQRNNAGISGGFGSMLTLTARKPGYIAPQRPSIFQLDDTISTTSAEIKLMPAAIITGRVSSSTSDSAANVRVMLLQHQVNDGERIWSPMNTQMTNSRGEFRFTDLRPGDYTVMTAEWQGEQQVPRPRTETTEMYPPVYYGDAHSLSTATKFHLHYGDTIAAEFHLHLATYYPVVIPVTGAAGPVSAMLDSFAGFQLGYNGRDNAVEGLLPNGDYTLTLTGRSPSQQQQSAALLPLHVAGSPVHTAPVTLAMPSPIEVHFHTQFTKPENSASPTIQVRSQRNPAINSIIQASIPAAQVTLRAEDSRAGYSTNRPRNDSDPTIDNVQPGKYFVQIQPFRGYVASATRGGVDVLQHPLVVGPSGGGEPIEITLRDDTATLNGTVNYGTNPPQQCVIMLVPIDAAARFTPSFAANDGKFTVPNLPPGSYRVLAFASDGTIPQIAWRDAEEMHRYDRKGATVTVAAGQTQSVEVHILEGADGVDE